MIQQFMQASLDQHKDHIEKFAELEKQIAELITKDSEVMINEGTRYDFDGSDDPDYRGDTDNSRD
jgi:hypothetical protein